MKLNLHSIQFSENLEVFAKFPGGDSKEATPVPIPNTVVKLLNAFGTSDAGPRERR